MRRNLLLVIVGLVALGILFVDTRPSFAQIAQPAQSDEFRRHVSDFPPQDVDILEAMRLGLMAKAVARATQSGRPADIAARLIAMERIDDAIAALRRAVAEEPSTAAPALAAFAGSRAWLDGTKPQYRQALREIVASVPAQISTLEREDGARLARQALQLDRLLAPPEERPGAAAYLRDLRTFIAKYAGTEQALLARVELMTNEGLGRLMPTIDELEAFGREHVGTVAGASALYQAGFQLAVNVGVTNAKGPGTDPTDRLLRVMRIARELESGEFPPCEWVDQARELVTGFYVPRIRPASLVSSPDNPLAYSPENIDRTIAAYENWIASHFVLDDYWTIRGGVGFVITDKVGALFALKGDANGIERLWDELEQRVPNTDAVRYLRALYYGSGKAGAAPQSERPALILRANELLEALSNRGGPYAQRALATLATQRLLGGDYEAAIIDYQRYLTTYPRNYWTWVAAIRLGQAEALAGHPERSAASFQRAATVYADDGMARAVAYAEAARLEETRGRFETALADDRRALNAWDKDFGEVYRFPPPLPLVGPPGDRQSSNVVRLALADRVDELTASLRLPHGSTLERGRWQMRQQRWAEARRTFEELAAQAPRSPVAAEARSLALRARLEMALALGDVTNPNRDDRAAATELEALSRESGDFSATAAMITRAALLWKGGAASDAREVMSRALDEWRARPGVSSDRTATNAINDDAAAIRDVLFLPAGGGIYGSSRWNAFEWPAVRPRFFVVSTDIQIKLADGEQKRAIVRRAIPGIDNALLFDTSQLEFFTTMMRRLGGTAVAAPRTVMATPNQPVGPSLSILALLNEFFPVRPGHFSGWQFQTYPAITSIRFQNAERTRATAAVRIGYSGGDVVLEKRNGLWRAVDLTNRWVE